MLQTDKSLITYGRSKFFRRGLKLYHPLIWFGKHGRFLRRSKRTANGAMAYARAVRERWLRMCGSARASADDGPKTA
jgi:hypothetical protein